jgi:hypothetical protein
MRLITLKEAMFECRRFIVLGQLAMDEQKNNMDHMPGTKKTGDVVRKSMDITRKLADLRQGR